MEYFETRRLQNRNYRRELLYAEYVAACKASQQRPYCYSSFCHLLTKWRHEFSKSKTQDWYPGEYMRTYWSYLQIDGKEKRLFVAQMVVSDLTFVKRCNNVTTLSWIEGCAEAFRYFGAVPYITDYPQTIAAKKTLDRLEGFAHHYRTVLYGARPKTAKTSKSRLKPIDSKNKSYVVTSIRNYIRDYENLNNEDIDSLINEAMNRYNNEPGSNGQSRWEVFEAQERPQMLELPLQIFPETSWSHRNVRGDYHIQINRGLYSVPYQYAFTKLRVGINDTDVSIYHMGSLVAKHELTQGRSGRMISTNETHRAPSHRAFANRLNDRFLMLAEVHGPGTKKVMKLLLRECKERGDGFLLCKQFLNLSKTPAKTTLEEACAQALKSPQPVSFDLVAHFMSLGREG